MARMRGIATRVEELLGQAVVATTPVAGEWRAAIPRACGSISRSSSRSIRRSPGTPLARPRRSSSASRGSSASRVATITLPVRRASMRRSEQ